MADRLGVSRMIRRQRRHAGLAFKRAVTGRHLVEHDAEGKDVGASVHGLPSACSGDMYAMVPRCVLRPVIMSARDGAQSTAAGSVAASPVRSRALSRGRRRHHHVGGFRSRCVMPRAVRRPPRRPAESRLQQGRADRRPRNHLEERLAFDEFHRQKLTAVHLLDGVDRDDVRVVRAAMARPPARSAGGAPGSPAAFVRQHFQRDVTPQAKDLFGARTPRPCRRRPTVCQESRRRPVASRR